MTARDDYAFPAAVADGRVNGGAYGQIECNNALNEIDRLREWKRQAIAVLKEWDAVYLAAGRPGRLGESQAAAVCRVLAGSRYSDNAPDREAAS